jgi:hypothetical protein
MVGSSLKDCYQGQILTTGYRRLPTPKKEVPPLIFSDKRWNPAPPQTHSSVLYAGFHSVRRKILHQIPAAERNRILI